MVSVIIPVYNAEFTITKTVESLVYGEYKDIEIILVDDCSKDNSWEVCLNLSSKFSNVFCYKNPENKGVSYTRNYGLQQAKGEYILFVDSDDWVSKSYAKTLVEYAEKYKGYLVICGHIFINNVDNYRTNYLWDNESKTEIIVEKKDYLDILHKFLLQQLWNKIFRKDIIDKHNIKFDISQSMGEDFEFVLDYMSAYNCEKCVVINKPLYYYLRANETSLMSSFGVIDNQNEYDRMLRLCKLSFDNEADIQSNYNFLEKQMKDNHTYHCVRNKKLSKKEKISFIGKLYNDGKEIKYYHNQQKTKLKEDVLNFLNNFKKIFTKIENRIKRIKQNYVIKKARKQLKNKDFSIISQNCIAGVFYNDMGMRFETPTINLYFSCPDFIKFAMNLKYYLSLDIEVKWDEEYPIGILDDIEVRFMHYESCTQAKEKWEDRKKRINFEKILVMSTDMEQFTDEVYSLWQKISYPKILFTANSKYVDDSVIYNNYESNGKVADLITKREFYKNNVLIEKINAL